MNQAEKNTLEKQIRREITKEIFKNEEGKFLSLPYDRQDVQYMSTVIKLSEKEIWNVLQENVFELIDDQIFKNLEECLNNEQQLYVFFESETLDDFIVTSEELWSWMKKRLTHFLSLVEHNLEEGIPAYTFERRK